MLVVSTGVVWLGQWVSHSNQPPLIPHWSPLILMPKGQCTLRLNLHLQSPWLASPLQETAIVQKPLPQSRLAVSSYFRTAIKYLNDIFLKKLQMTEPGLNQCMSNASRSTIMPYLIVSQPRTEQWPLYHIAGISLPVLLHPFSLTSGSQLSQPQPFSLKAELPNFNDQCGPLHKEYHGIFTAVDHLHMVIFTCPCLCSFLIGRELLILSSKFNTQKIY